MQLSPLAALPVSILHPYCLSLRRESHSLLLWGLPMTGTICVPSIFRYKGYSLLIMTLGYQWLKSKFFLLSTGVYTTGPSKHWSFPLKGLLERVLHCCKCCKCALHLASVGVCATPLRVLWVQSPQLPCDGIGGYYLGQSCSSDGPARLCTQQPVASLSGGTRPLLLSIVVTRIQWAGVSIQPASKDIIHNHPPLHEHPAPKALMSPLHSWPIRP